MISISVTLPALSWSSKNGICSDLDELASRVEALADQPPEGRQDGASRKRLLEAMKKAIPELETPAEATQRVPYSVSNGVILIM
jgi:hypothetical protein